MKRRNVVTPWIFERFRDDAMIYMICPVCNHIYATNNKIFTDEIRTIYNYCPNCGERRWRKHTKIKIIKGRRRLYDLFE